MTRISRTRVPTIAGVAAALTSVLAFAQNAPDSAPATAAPKTLPKVRVSADEPDTYEAQTSTSLRTDTLLRDEPTSVTVVTRKLIDDQNMQNLADVVRYVPGIGIAQGEGNRDNPVFRGSSTSGDLFIDGLRDDVEYYRDLYNIERVEALKGPNGMLFGRGGVGGVINRVSKQAGFDTYRSAALQGGSYDNGRIALDLNQPFNASVALRLNAMFEDSDTYRDDVSLKRYGVNPTMTFRFSEATLFSVGAEYFHDERTADRGVSSFAGRPLETDPSEFFGDPAQSETHSTVKAASALFEHQFGEGVTLRNRTRYGNYDKFYQNVYPGVVDVTGSNVQIVAYNNAMQRDNFFNQTDLLFSLESGAVKHSLLAGVELGRQVTDNFRNTGFFDTISPTTTFVVVPVSDPRTTLPVSFRQSATDADNHGVATIAAAYVQDQIEFSPRWLATLGLRYDNFQMDFDNHRSSTTFNSDDGLISPRAGLVYKPVEPLSLYASYSLSYQPRAGAQLSSLNLSNEALDPEEFTNYEVGAKWDVVPGLAFTAAVVSPRADQRCHRGSSRCHAFDPGRRSARAGSRTRHCWQHHQLVERDGCVCVSGRRDRQQSDRDGPEGSKVGGAAREYLLTVEPVRFQSNVGCRARHHQSGQHARRDREPRNACSECHAPGVHTSRCRSLLRAELTPAHAAQHRESLRRGIFCVRE